jgi:capsid protein
LASPLLAAAEVTIRVPPSARRICFVELPDYDQRRREYLACGWLPPKWDWVNRAEIEQIDAGLKSRTQALAERGYDVEQVDAEIAADRAREKSPGLSFGYDSEAAAIVAGSADENQNAVD